MTLNESSIENHTLNLLSEVGFAYVPTEELEAERESFEEVVLRGRLLAAVQRLNPEYSAEMHEHVVKEVLRAARATDDVVENNRAVQRLLVHGVTVEVQEGEHMRGRTLRVIDWQNLLNNDYISTNQFAIHGLREKIPDVVLFVNGLPVVVVELKDAKNAEATVHKAFTQLTNYQHAVPALFAYNALLVISDGLDARMGTITSDFKRFLAWKSVDGAKEERKTVPQIETMVRGMFTPYVLLDLIRNFTIFESEKRHDDNGLTFTRSIKKVAAYHQYFAVNKAVASTVRAAKDVTEGIHELPARYGLPSVDVQEEGDRRAGVVWHTQGSGKSLSMVFYAGKIVQAMQNPTIVVVTDRNDLDQQLFETFAGAKDVLGQEPVQALSREDLKTKLRVAGGGIVFTTMQKFSSSGDDMALAALSDRRNIVVIADEAHRSQYGFSARVAEKDGEARIVYGFAKYLRDALPNASFIGFTGTPVEKEDANTRSVFGEYVDVYDIQDAVEDGATVPISYESRLVQVALDDTARAELDAAVEEVYEGEELTVSERSKARYAQIEAVVGNATRLADVAKDIVAHFEARQEVFEGKAMIVAMSRRIAVDLYRELVKIRPDWHSDDRDKGALKVVMTTSSSDPVEWQPFHTTKDDRSELAVRFKDTKDPLKLVIVRDMWLTGFDVPCLHTMYVDKPMRGANLMQAIARVNRVFKDKPGGLIVDYIGIAGDLKRALATYTESGGTGRAVDDIRADIIPQLIAKCEIVHAIMNDCPHCVDYEAQFAGDTQQKLRIILEAEDCILANQARKERFLREVTALSQLFALASPDPETVRMREQVAFFQAVKARITKLASDGGSRDVAVETSIRQIIDRAVASEGVIDIFDAAGIKKPDVSVLSEEFLEEVRTMKHKNIGFEVLQRILNGEIRAQGKRNFALSKKFSEKLEELIRRYRNNLLTSAEIIAELIDLAREMRAEQERGALKGLSDDEVAFYDALALNGDAGKVMGDDTLKMLAQLLVQQVQKNATIDWNRREGARAKMRIMVKGLLRMHGYPPEGVDGAVETVLQQAEVLAGR